MTEDLTVHPTRVTGLEPPLAAAVARHGLRADPCSSLRCLSLNLREAGDPVRLFCPTCHAPTVQATQRGVR